MGGATDAHFRYISDRIGEIRVSIKHILTREMHDRRDGPRISGRSRNCRMQVVENALILTRYDFPRRRGIQNEPVRLV